MAATIFDLLQSTACSCLKLTICLMDKYCITSLGKLGKHVSRPLCLKAPALPPVHKQLHPSPQSDTLWGSLLRWDTDLNVTLQNAAEIEMLYGELSENPEVYRYDYVCK